MNIQSFLKLVEIRTKLASLIPFIAGTLFTIYHFAYFSLKNFFLMLISLFLFDMTTTAINNYYDYKRAKVMEGYNYEEHNAIGRDGLSLGTVKKTILFMLFLAILAGIFLAFNTNLVVLFIGVLSFFIGVIYSFGPVPINATPFGEAMSGFFMGFIIVFLSIYIHTIDASNYLTTGIFGYFIKDGILEFRIEISWVFKIIVFAVPHMFCIANIMLANNICDMEEDIRNKRYTLPNFIGKEMALILYQGLYLVTFAAIIFAVIINALPKISLIGIFAFIPVYKNVKLFVKLQSKKDTFALTVKNYFLISVSQLAMLGIAIIIK